jgi:AraC-like DNA-binding protein
MIGLGMAVASADLAAENDQKMERQAASVAACADFFKQHGISTPSVLFNDLQDTYYFAKNRAGQFVWGNRLLQEQHGVASVIGRSDHDFFRHDIADRIRADDLQVMDSGEAVKNKLEVIDGNNGTLAWLFTTKAPLRDRHGEIVGVEGFSRDAKRSEEAMAPFHVFKSCIEYVQAHLTEDISIEHLASLSCMSLSTFERKFKQHFSLTPKQYILRMKIHEACRLLPGTQSIARVAVATGFGGQSYFTKIFRSVVGITPKQYQLSLIASGRMGAVRRSS